MKTIVIYAMLAISVLCQEWWVNEIPEITVDNVA